MCPPTEPLSRRPGSTRNPRKHKQTEHSTSKEHAYRRAVQGVGTRLHMRSSRGGNTPTQVQSKGWPTAPTADSAARAQGDVASSQSSVSPFTWKKCLRSKPRREETKDTICKAHEVGQEKAWHRLSEYLQQNQRTAHSCVGKCSGQPRATVTRDTTTPTKSRTPYESPQMSGLRQKRAPRTMSSKPGSH